MTNKTEQPQRRQLSDLVALANSLVGAIERCSAGPDLEAAHDVVEHATSLNDLLQQADVAVAPAAQGRLFTHVRRGGTVYEYLGRAKAAGTLSEGVPLPCIVAYRSTETGAVYLRTEQDFEDRMTGTIFGRGHTVPAVVEVPVAQQAGQLAPDEIHQMAFEEGRPAEDGNGYAFTAEEFDLFIDRLLNKAARTTAVEPSAQVPAVAPLQWSDVQPPAGYRRYDHVTADTPFGTYSIEWKSWKEDDWPVLYLNGEYIVRGVRLEDAKAHAAQHWTDKVLSCLELVADVPAGQ